MLHGALGDEKQFNPLKSRVNKSQVYTLNFSGHGGRAMEPEFSISQFSEELRTFIDGISEDDVYIFGYSMGGYVALDLVSQGYEKIKGIITLGTKFDWTPESVSRELKMLNPDKIQEKLPGFAQILKNRHAPVDWRENLKRTGEMMATLGEGAALSEMDFNKIQTPVLLMVGGQDNMVSEEETVITSDRIPGSKYIILENFEHPLEKIDKDTVAFIIEDFIGE
jgi:pimeloyl-ACP methyl ester carboxylesterase